MVTMQHQAPLDLVRRNPAIVAVLLSKYLGVTLPKFDAIRMGPTDVNRVQTSEDGKSKVKERRSDNVAVFTRKIDADTDPEWLAATKAQWEEEWPGKFEDAIADGCLPVLAVIVESQRTKEKEKRSAWPEYVDGTRSQCRCPTMLLVLAGLIHVKDNDADIFMRAFMVAVNQFSARERLEYTEALGEDLQNKVRQRLDQYLKEESAMEYKSELVRMLAGPALDEGERIGADPCLTLR